MTDTTTPALDLLSARLGIWLSFQDPDSGQVIYADTESKRSVCRALGFNGDDEGRAKTALNRLRDIQSRDFAPPVMVVRCDELSPLNMELHVPEKLKNKTISFTLTREDSTTSGGAFLLSDEQIVETIKTKGTTVLRCQVALNISVPNGYHDISFLSDGVTIDHTNMQTRLIVVPRECYCPDDLKNGGQAFGVPLQLYALKSKRNWGMGDLTDLKNFMVFAGQHGAKYVGLNPLNALFTDAPEEASPYYVSSRLFLNPMYIDTDAVPESVGLPAYDAYKHSDRFLQVLAYCQSSETVEYAFVSELKYTALALLFQAFKALHLNADLTPKTARGEAFVRFMTEQGTALDRFALWTVLRQYFIVKGDPVQWQAWPKAFQNPDSTRISAFAVQHKDAILFVKYQQFLAFEQYERAVRPVDRSTPYPSVYTDMPVGVSPDSADVWSDQSVFLDELTIGAPPDLFNSSGQNWSLAAFHPERLKQRRYEPFIRLLREKMKFGGAVRLDHAFSLMRLFLRPNTGGGAYLSYPFSDLSGILALESQRNACLVIAEDLGTPPPAFYDLMRAAGALSFRLFRYERYGTVLKEPHQYDRQCLIMTGSHDMPTLSAVWKGTDLDLMRSLNVLSVDRYHHDLHDRQDERQAYLNAFSKQHMMVDYDVLNQTDQVPDWLIPNLYTYLARSNSMLMLVRLEDVLLQDEQLNVPGTYREYPNWRFKLPVSLEDLPKNPLVQHVFQVVRSNRNKGS